MNHSILMSETFSLTRRAFLEKAATITAIGFAAPHLASAADPSPSASNRPNSRVHVGLIGCGGMGRANLAACASQPDVVVTGACDVWPSPRARRARTFTCKSQ